MKKIELSLPERCRIVCISDIHGNYDTFCRLLDKCGYNENNDYLFILGDIIEKGKQNTDTLRKVKQLAENPKTYVIKGNNDTMCPRMAFSDSREKFLSRLEYRPFNAFIEMANSLGISDFTDDFEEKRGKVQDAFIKELEFLDSLPTAIETEDYIFIHAGIENRPDWENGDEGFMLCEPWFLRDSHMSPKTVVCGHYPCFNYKRGNNSNLPIIDTDKRIIDIDGGASTKSAAQLNAFVINKNGSEYSYENYFEPTASEKVTVRRSFKSDCVPEYVDWENHWLSVIDKTGELLYVKNEITGATGTIPEKFTGSWDGKLHGWISLNAFLSVDAGEAFWVFKRLENYCFGIAQNGQVGMIPIDCVE
ncbi:MAG: metallophosphoesterase [Eubacterium sp.]|nr:metallophosphoesterase [Eubacterium sp.]